MTATVGMDEAIVGLLVLALLAVGLAIPLVAIRMTRDR
jgi:thiol:disulfide interchange protein